MIRTLYTDPKGLLDILKRSAHVTQAEEQDLVKAAAASVFYDLGITMVDTREEYEQVLAQVPKPLLIRTLRLGDGGWIFLHGYVKDLPDRV
jgi:hypothetical protein